MRISFCITCKGRLHHLRETLPGNLRDNADHPDLEFVLLDYNSGDGLEAWARETLAPWIASGRVVYYREKSAAAYRSCHAKNVAHALATGDVVCNLDADNFTGAGYATALAALFEEEGERILVTGGPGGLFGRLALRSDTFRILRGYDEDLQGWGYDDEDLRVRGAHWGLRLIPLVVEGMRALEHSDEERTRFMPGAEDKWRKCEDNFILTHGKRERNEWLPNLGRVCGEAVVFRNFAEEPIRAGWT
jgi:hypothetical protein